MRSDADIEDAIASYGDAVLHVCVARLSNRHDAEDAFQDTFVRYANRKEAFADEDHRRAWLLRVAMNRCKDIQRAAHSSTIPMREATDAPSPSCGGEIAERDVLLKALDRLSEEQRTALVLSAVDGYSVPEIAQMMGKRQNTVYSYITRGRRKLKKVLEHD